MITPSPTANAQDVTNPNAFPFSADYGHPAACGGMTLRDWFAGKATDDDVRDFRTSAQGRDCVHFTNTRSEARYAFADAMLATRVQVSA